MPRPPERHPGPRSSVQAYSLPLFRAFSAPLLQEVPMKKQAVPQVPYKSVFCILCSYSPLFFKLCGLSFLSRSLCYLQNYTIKSDDFKAVSPYLPEAAPLVPVCPLKTVCAGPFSPHAAPLSLSDPFFRRKADLPGADVQGKPYAL